MHSYKAEAVPGYHESEILSRDFKFKLFDCLFHKDSSESRLDATCLVIGFKKTSEGLKYVLIPNSIISGEDVETKLVDKDHMEEHFRVVDRPNYGILRRPFVGDKVMCVAKGRYGGIHGGNIKKVLGMPEGRVKVWDNHNATYDHNYFIVVEDIERMDGMGEVNSSKPITDTSGSMRISLIDPEIKKRAVMQVDKLIVRKKIDTKTVEKRTTLTPRIIQRIK